MTLVERIPVEEIAAEAEQLEFRRVVLTIFAAVFFAVGWLAGKAWAAVAWSMAAAKVGWREARATSGPQPPGS